MAQTKNHCLIATLSFYLASACLTHAYEQSSYYIFDIIEAQKAEPVSGRIAVSATAFAMAEKENTIRPTVTTKRSEFEIDFNQPLQSGGKESATFTFDQAIELTDDLEPSGFGTESFGLGTTQSAFGE